MRSLLNESENRESKNEDAAKRVSLPVSETGIGRLKQRFRFLVTRLNRSIRFAFFELMGLGLALVRGRKLPKKRSRVRPILLAIVVLGCGAWFLVFGLPAQRLNHLKSVIRAKTIDRDFAGAAKHYEELFQLHPELLSDFESNYLDVVIQSRDETKIQEVISRFAPESSPAGHPQAHRAVAIRLARKIRVGENNQLDRLKWHLANAGDDDSELLVAKARYAIAMGDQVRAAEHFISAAKKDDPIQFLKAALIFEKLKLHSRWQQTLLEAKTALSTKLKITPKDATVRLALSEAFFKLKNFEECESTLLDGLAIHPTMQLKRSCSAFYVKRFLELEQTADFEQGFEFGTLALQFQPTNVMAQQVLTELYRSETEKHRKQIVEFAREQLADDSTLINADKAAYEFLMSECSEIDGDIDRSIIHAQAATKLMPNRARYQHALAQRLLQENEPNWVSAEQSAKIAVQLEPGVAQYQLSHGLILTQLKEYVAATESLQRGLLRLTNRSERDLTKVHQALAICYRELGHPELSKKHSMKMLKNRDQ